jgi:hypothetical protein
MVLVRVGLVGADYHRAQPRTVLVLLARVEWVPVPISQGPMAVLL